MKFIGAIALLLAFAASYSQSCCCTGAGSSYTILPNLNQHLIGLRVSYKNFYNEVRSLNPELNGNTTVQHFTSAEIFGRFNLNERLQFSVFMPYVFIQQQENNNNVYTNSIGDMSLLLQYHVLNPLRCTGKKTKHQLRIGAGLKLPSGTFKMNERNLFLTNLQTGTGSTDFLLNAIYTLRVKNYGLNTHATYRFNTANPQQYRFGDRLQAGASFFYIAQWKDWQLMPSLGFNYEYQSYNRHKAKLLTFTGGQFLNAATGMDVYYKRFAFSSTFSPTLMNLLNWSGENKSRFSIEAGVYYNFSTKSN